MLVHLAIRNFALVAELELDFNEGLTVLTGESGTGKTILLNALALVLGSRASRSQMRPAAEFCEVVAEFDVTSLEEVTEHLAEHELVDTDQPHICMVRRIARSDGRSRAWINSVPVNLNELRTLCSRLVEVHDQFEQRQLMDTKTQLVWFDGFLEDPTVKQGVFDSFNAWQRLDREYSELTKQQQIAQEKRDLLEYQVKELDQAGLSDGEFEDLDARFKRLSQAQEIRETLYAIQTRLEGNVTDELGQINTAVNRIKDDAEPLRQTIGQLESASINIDEALDYLKRYAELFEFDETEIESMSERIDLVHDLARKHRCRPLEVWKKHEELAGELQKLDQGEENLQTLETQVADAKCDFLSNAERLSEARHRAREPFSSAVVDLLRLMGMKDAKFDVRFIPTSAETGLERVEYLVTANSKYAPNVLQKVASGGELSRISLAIFIVVAQRMRLPCLILDEADIGVGGTTADTVGRLLRKLAQNSQVICVTHAPQVAALGNSHIKVFKNEVQDIQVASLDEVDRIEEIARMVGGRKVNESSRDHARSLLLEASSEVMEEN